MNIRSRLVIVIVIKLKWMEFYVIFRRLRLLEFNGFIAFLIFVFDYDSYESFDFSEDEWEREELRRNVENEEKII